MSEEKVLVERLAELLKDLPSSMAPAVEEARSRIFALHSANDELLEAREAVQKLLQRTEKEVVALTEENESLRISLHLRELEVARLEGYQARVNEFDPVSDQQEYADKLPAVARKQPSYHDGASVMAGCDRAPWFARGRRA